MKLKKYTFEFLSIFIAVISAFALNNWNQQRNDRNAEEKILSEISIGLEKDLDDVHENIMGHKIGINAVRYFRSIIAQDSVSKDSLFTYYFNLCRDFISIQNTSGYETLKSKGLELIQNDSLRTKIISLYEYDYNTLRKFEEEYYEMQFFRAYYNDINRLLAPHLIVNEQKNFLGLQLPLELSDDDEKLLLSHLWRIGNNRGFVLGYYKVVEAKIEELREAIDQELGKVEVTVKPLEPDTVIESNQSKP